MANVEIKKDGETKMILSVTVPKDDLQPFLEEAAAELSKDVKIDGWRAGKAPYAEVAKKVGEMAVLEKALNSIVRKTFVSAIVEQGLETVGAPDIEVKTLAPGNDLHYTATVSLVPHVKKLADWKNMQVKPVSVVVTDKEVEQALSDLQSMQQKEVRATSDEGAGKTDKVVVDLDMKKDGVPVEGGQSKGSFVFMGEESYLPGLQDALLGMKEGEEKVFPLTFPKEHFQKHLAGALVEVTAHVKEIFHIERPTIDDAFAKGVGIETLDALKKKLNENIGAEKEREESARQERTLLEDIAKASEFEEMPASLVENEVQKMLFELHRHVNEQGLEFEAYLSSLKKSVEDLKKEFEPQAKRRLEIALLLKHVAKEEGIEIPEAEIDRQIDASASGVKDAATRERLYSPEYREYQASVSRNRAVIERLKSVMTA